MSDQPKPTTGELEARITEYLCAGGLFNPELMEHKKVRDLLMDCRAALAALRDENKTFRAAQKACEDCDAPTMAEVQQLREQLAAALDAINKHNDWIENNDDVQQRCYVITLSDQT